MKIHRFSYNFNFNDGLMMIKDREIIHQMKNVLKLQKSERIVLVDLGKKEALCEIANIANDFLQLKLLEQKDIVSSRLFEVNLCCSVLKKDNFEWVVQKATEIGVDMITPIVFQKTIKTNLNFKRLETIALEAIEQSERLEKVRINEIFEFKQILLKKIFDGDINIIFNKTGADFVKFFDKIKVRKEKRINLFVGPEGGFSADELFLAEQSGFFVVTLGNTNLRAETAAILASFVANNMI